MRSPDADPIEVAIDFCMNWLTTDRNRFYTMMMLSLDPALPPEAVIAKEKNLRAIQDFIMRFAGIDAEYARQRQQLGRGHDAQRTRCRNR